MKVLRMLHWTRLRRTSTSAATAPPPATAAEPRASTTRLQFIAKSHQVFPKH